MYFLHERNKDADKVMDDIATGQDSLPLYVIIGPSKAGKSRMLLHLQELIHEKQGLKYKVFDCVTILELLKERYFIEAIVQEKYIIVDDVGGMSYEDEKNFENMLTLATSAGATVVLGVQYADISIDFHDVLDEFLMHGLAKVINVCQASKGSLKLLVEALLNEENVNYEEWIPRVVVKLSKDIDEAVAAAEFLIKYAKQFGGLNFNGNSSELVFVLKNRGIIMDTLFYNRPMIPEELAQFVIDSAKESLMDLDAKRDLLSRKYKELVVSAVDKEILIDLQLRILILTKFIVGEVNEIELDF